DGGNRTWLPEATILVNLPTVQVCSLRITSRPCLRSSCEPCARTAGTEETRHQGGVARGRHPSRREGRLRRRHGGGHRRRGRGFPTHVLELLRQQGRGRTVRRQHPVAVVARRRGRSSGRGLRVDGASCGDELGAPRTPTPPSGVSRRGRTRLAHPGPTHPVASG